jgi:hypothetical protein
VGQAFPDEHRADISSARSQNATRAAIVAPRCAFGAGATGAGNPLEIETTTSDKLAKPKRRPVAEVPLRWALRTVSFRRVKTDKPKGFASNPNRVAVQHLDLTGIKRAGIRNRGDEGEDKGKTANNRWQSDRGKHEPKSLHACHH